MAQWDSLFFFHVNSARQIGKLCPRNPGGTHPASQGCSAVPSSTAAASYTWLLNVMWNKLEMQLLGNVSHIGELSGRTWLVASAMDRAEVGRGRCCSTVLRVIQLSHTVSRSLLAGGRSGTSPSARCPFCSHSIDEDLVMWLHLSGQAAHVTITPRLQREKCGLEFVKQWTLRHTVLSPHLVIREGSGI